MNSVIIVGANGTGKSKLGAWMEQQEMERVHRIGAQRDINISEHIQQKSYADASKMMLYGKADEARLDKGYRWNFGKAYTTKLIKDFDDTLAALMALDNKVNREYVTKRKLHEIPDSQELGESPLDRAISIWDDIFPARELVYDVEAGEFRARVRETGEEYHASGMSDGERSVLYLTAQVLSIPADDKSRVLIMDEPEVHLNRSLLGSLWGRLEEARPDCLFVYITHDVDFASSHSASDKVWVRDFDGKRWDIGLLEKDDGLPEPLLFGLIGNRRPVLFVEGTYGSLDYAVYSAAYPGWQVMPVGGCSQVIESVRAFRANKQMHGYQVRGIIDRDYRSDEQLAALEKDGICHLDVAEIENLFLMEPVIRLMIGRLAYEKDADDVVASVKSYVIDDRFAPQAQMEKHEKAALELRLKNGLASVDLTSIALATVSSDVVTLINEMNLPHIVDEIKDDFESAAVSKDYDRVLALLNEKGVANTIGHFLGVDNRQYVEKALALLRGEDSAKLLEAMRPCLPAIEKLEAKVDDQS